MAITAIDHIALPIKNVDEMLSFYQNLGFEISRQFAPDFYSANIGNNKINFHAPHIWKQEKVLRGATALPGCGDVCFVWEGTEEALISLFKETGELGRIKAGPNSCPKGPANKAKHYLPIKKPNDVVALSFGVYG
jgi:hypothetical protein